MSSFFGWQNSQHLRGQGGFTHIIIPAAIACFMSAYVFSLQTIHIHQAKAKARNMSHTSLNQLANRLLLTLGSRHQCQLNFKGLTFGAVTEGFGDFTGIEKLIVAAENDPSLPGPDLIKVGDYYEDIKIESIELLRYVLVAPGSRSYRGALVIVGTKGERAFHHSVPAYITMNSENLDQINDCSLTQIVTDTTTVEDELCILRNNGTNTYDPSNFAGCINTTHLFSYAKATTVDGATSE